MERGNILGISGMERTFAVSLFLDGAAPFAIEEDKLRRFRGLGMQQLKSLGSRAIDMAVSRVPGGIRSIERTAYVPPMGAGADQIAGQCAFVSEFLQRFYGFSPPVTAVNHIQAHLAFECAVHGDVDVLYAGRSRAVYSRSGAASYDFDRDFHAVWFVRTCAEFLGLTQNQIQHLENMARHGEPVYGSRLESLLDERAEPECIHNALEQMTGSPRLYFRDSFRQVQYNLAASVHAVLQAKVFDLVRGIPEPRRNGRVALSGGVFQSWSLNDAIARKFPATQFLVSFAPGDPSCAIGGALVLAGGGHRLTPFLGPQYSPNDVKDVLDNCKARYEFCSSRDALEATCSALAAGKMVGWFSGRCEFGYRALGARSVFANPANPYACENLTSFLKRRPRYFTYAVAMKESDAAGMNSPYLSRSMRLPQYFGDSSVRIQTVSKTANPLLYQLLEAFQAGTGVPALLNTSLNYFDEPIACTPRDALKTFYASGLDMLVMENFVLRKS